MPRPFSLLIVLAAVSAVVLADPGGARADDDPAAARDRLDDVRKELEDDRSRKAALDEEAARKAAELERLRAELSAAAAAAQRHEAQMSALEDDLRALVSENEAKTAALTARREQLGDSLAALQRMSLRPIAALAVSPGDPHDVIRSGLLLRTTVPQIEAQTRALKAQLAEIAALRREMAAKREKLNTASASLAQEKKRLGELATAKKRSVAQTEAERKAAQQRIARLVAEAKTLEELLARLNRPATAVPKPKPPASGAPAAAPQGAAATPRLLPISEARGRLTPPAQGAIIEKFGAPTDTGGKTRGVTWRTRADAVVVAPWEGRVVFSGEFRKFGRILIIDHGEGYHSLIAGLERLDAQIDQWVLAGEPVGVAGSAKIDNSLNRESRAAKGQGGGVAKNGVPTLYVELRHDGQPINPLPWMAASTDRTRG